VSEIQTLQEAEQRLQQAQLASDVAALDRLLHPSLTFVGPDGVLSDKARDLEVHRTGELRIDSLETHDLIVRITEGVGITVLTARLEGVYAGLEFADRMRYTRCWASGAEGWRIVAAHATVLGATTS